MVGNSNTENSKENLFNSLQKHSAAKIVKGKTCFKSLDNPAVTVLKVSFSKAPLKEMLHRDYKSCHHNKFKYELKNRIQNESIECYNEFEKVFVDILNEQTLLKRSSQGLIMLLI